MIQIRASKAEAKVSWTNQPAEDEKNYSNCDLEVMSQSLILPPTDRPYFLLLQGYNQSKARRVHRSYQVGVLIAAGISRTVYTTNTGRDTSLVFLFSPTSSHFFFMQCYTNTALEFGCVNWQARQRGLLLQRMHMQPRLTQ